MGYYCLLGFAKIESFSQLEYYVVLKDFCQFEAFLLLFGSSVFCPKHLKITNPDCLLLHTTTNNLLNFQILIKYIFSRKIFYFYANL